MTGKQCAEFAMGLLDGNPIPYVLGGESIKGMDCQGLIEYVARALGGEMAFRGSNDMFRNACSYVGPLEQAKKEGRLVPGAVLFIVKHDGGELPNYKDGKGNASHVGWYTGGQYEVVHASASRGKVAPSTLRNGWTHVGWLKAVEYQELKEKEGKQMETLSLGTRGEQVKEMQQLLQGLGYDIGSRTGADGIFGKATQAAVERYQRDRGLPLTGVWDNQAQASSSSFTEELAEKPAVAAIAQRLGVIAFELAQLANELS